MIPYRPNVCRYCFAPEAMYSAIVNGWEVWYCNVGHRDADRGNKTARATGTAEHRTLLDEALDRDPVAVDPDQIGLFE